MQCQVYPGQRKNILYFFKTQKYTETYKIYINMGEESKL